MLLFSPSLKKNGLDPFNMSNFRPISKLPFISKVLEKIVLEQLNDFLKRNNILGSSLVLELATVQSLLF